MEIQRFFVQGPHSHYMEVQCPQEATEAQVRPDQKKAAIERLWQRMNEYAEQTEQRKRDSVGPGEESERTPWIRRTRWDDYLKDCDRNELLDPIAEPNPVDSEDMSEQAVAKREDVAT